MLPKESQFAGVGGLSIYWRAWLPDPAPRAVVVISHGGSEHSGRYSHVAERLVSNGYAVYALDHRGHGRSEGRRSLIDRLDNAVEDLDKLVAMVAAEQPGLSLFLLGHSVGGAIGIAYAVRHQDRLAGLILSGPLAALEAASPGQRLAARVLSFATPNLGLFSIDPSLVSRDPAVVEAYLDDPLVYHGKLPVRTVAELAAAIDRFPTEVGRITVPVLIMYGDADGICPPQGSVMLSERIGSTDKTVKVYEGLYHEILNEPERQEVLDEICSWLGARTGALDPA